MLEKIVRSTRTVVYIMITVLAIVMGAYNVPFLLQVLVLLMLVVGCFSIEVGGELNAERDIMERVRRYTNRDSDT